jgi:hypothetical protein
MIKEYSILYALKEKEKLQVIFEDLVKQKIDIDQWFVDFGNKYSNSVLSKAPYESVIRKPYNEKFDEYEELMLKYRSVNYYLELLNER